jgi:peroxiredoxin
MSVFLTLVRLALAGVFGYAALAKLHDPDRTRRSLVDFGVPALLARPAAYLLPGVELAVALLLVRPATAFPGAVGGLLLLAAFTAGIAANLWLGRQPDCNCFGQRRARPIGRRTLVRNAVLLTLSAVLVAAGPGNSGLDVVGWAADLPGGLQALAAGTLLVAGLLAAQSLLLIRVLRQNRQILERLAALPATIAAPSEPDGAGDQRTMTLPSALTGLKPGTPAPDFSLENLAGDTVSLVALRSPGRPLVLVFADAGCAPCRALLPDVALWQREHGDRFDLAVISRGTADANRTKFPDLDPARVLLQEQREVARAYRSLGTPSAVVVSADGTIADPVANAEKEIRDLIWRLVRPGTSEPHAPLVPDFMLADLDGTTIAAGDLRGKTALLVFYGVGCGPCRRLVPDLRAWEAQPDRDGRLIVLSNASREECLALGLSSTVLLDPDSTVRKLVGLPGTPAAALLDRAGFVVTKVSGRRGILRLLGAPAGAALLGATAAPSVAPVPETLLAEATFLKDSCVSDELLADGSMILYNSCRRKMVTLNATGALIWECCDGTHTIDGMAAEIRDVFPDAAGLEQSVHGVLAGLLGDGMVVVNSPERDRVLTG